MLQPVSKFFVRVMQRYLPDPFLFAVILTFIVFILGIALTDNGPLQMVQHWVGGFWNLLAFSMQMVLILVTGFILANSPLFKKALGAIASVAKTPGQGIMLVGIVSALASWINWGFGLVIGALVAKEVARRVPNVHFPLLIATAYMGFVVWHAGLAGSVPLVIATEGHFLAAQIGVIPTSQTIFAPFNLIIAIVILILVPILGRMMMPPADESIAIDPNLLVETENTYDVASSTPAEKLENSPVVSILISIMGFTYIIHYFFTKGFNLNLNIVIFTFLFMGILLHWTPRSFLNSLTEAIKGSSGIVVQFPFYAGIMGMMITSGLAALMSQWFVSISTETTFPLFTFLSAGLVNIFVPSGGGQWAVQAPIMVPAGIELGVDTARVAMAVAWGDAWTNMIQPFWALPALAIAGLGAKDIMGYTTVMLIVSGVLIGLGLVVL